MMRNSTRASAAFVLTLIFTAASAQAQRAPSVVEPAKPSTSSPSTPAPSEVKVKYEGGMLGCKKQDGWISFDDVNERLVFSDKNRRELFSLSYDALLALWADTKSQTSTAGRVIAGTAPYGLGLPALLMRSKSRYLVVQYRDPDTRTSGLTSFKISDKELLHTVLRSLADKAELTPRGDAYVRRVPAPSKDTDATDKPE